MINPQYLSTIILRWEIKAWHIDIEETLGTVKLDSLYFKHLHVQGEVKVERFMFYFALVTCKSTQALLTFIF